MIFTEARFFAFFLLVWIVHWALRGRRARTVWLLVVSYAFYAAWDVRFVSLIALSTAVDFVVGARLGSTQRVGARRGWLALSLVVNLGLLATFKYLGFFVDSAVELCHWFGWEIRSRTLSWVLPVGISFYTFQTLSYSLDVYAGRGRPARSWVDFALFVSFFPQLVAGPIMRARELLPQIEASHRWCDVPVRGCLLLFAFGYFKKACVSDALHPETAAVFAGPEAVSALTAWLAIGLYSVQVYCDFSGYTDMALGLAGLLGFRLCRNFDHPMLASSLTAFWRRWHITLSLWMRDYVYKPLGGRRVSAPRAVVNLWITFLLIGLWHGASWNMIAFGAMQALGITIHRWWVSVTTDEETARSPIAGVLGWLLTMTWLSWSWCFFATEHLTDAAELFVSLWGGSSTPTAALSILWLWPMMGLALAHLTTRSSRFSSTVAKLPAPLFAVAYGLFIAVCLAFTQTTHRPFLYFQF